MINESRLESAYVTAYRENNPSLMNERLHTFEDCVWLYENSVKDFKVYALRNATSKVNTWNEFKWLMKNIYLHLFIKENVDRIKKTKTEIKNSFRDL